MKEEFARTALLLGEKGMEKLSRARVAVFGIGGVGGYVCEALVRSGVGAFDLIDKDEVALSNLNRQIIATLDTVGQNKAEVMRKRMLSINPDVDVKVYKTFFLPENSGDFNFKDYDYVVDAVDTVTAKIELILKAHEADVPVISSMGAGNKLDPSKFRVADIYATRVCPLARVMRRELKKRGVESLKVVYSEEEPIKREGKKEADEEDILQDKNTEDKKRVKDVPGSTAFVPSAAGLLIASEVVRDLVEK